MQPYQKASEALRSGGEYPLNVLKNAGLTAIGGGAATIGSKAINKLIPAIGALINQYVPENISISGLNKIDPRFGKFIQGALNEGYSYDDLREFLGDKIEKSQPKEQGNIIKQYSPELHEFISSHIQQGRSPLEAGAIAQSQKHFQDVIKKMSKDHKSPFSSILETVYGQVGQQEGIAQQQQQQPQEPAQSQQAGQGQQALMAILQKINQRIG